VIVWEKHNKAKPPKSCRMEVVAPTKEGYKRTAGNEDGNSFFAASQKINNAYCCKIALCKKLLMQIFFAILFGLYI